MKRKLYQVVGVGLCVSMGWAFGYLRIPSIGTSSSFWLGFAACLGFVGFILVLLSVWKKNTMLLGLIRNTPSEAGSKKAQKTYIHIWILVSLFILIGGLLSSLMIHQQKTAFKTQILDQNTKIEDQSQLIETVRKGNLAFLMSHVLNKVDRDLREREDHTLSEESLSSISKMNQSFKPYRSYTAKGLSNKKLSPERGQLLLALSVMKIDSSSFSKLKSRTPFAGADLGGADLKGVDLSGIDLRNANLREADLSGADLTGAELGGAIMWGAKLHGATLNGADLVRTDLKWAELNEAEMREANLNGAYLGSAQLIKANLQDATFQWADVGGAIFNEANLQNSDFFGAQMQKVNFTGSNLTLAYFRKADLSEAIFVGADMTQAKVEEDWFERIHTWHISGAKEIENGYILHLDTTGGKKGDYRLVKMID
jgi:uncharacterized protein YjbI with pentapeptide repeats